MNELLNGLFGNVVHFPGYVSQQQTAFQNHLQSAGLANALRGLPEPVPGADELKRLEISRKNRENYARWLARMKREPLQDVPFR